MINARIYIRIFMAILFLGMMPSCTYDTIHIDGVDGDTNVTLTLSLDDQVINTSRAYKEEAAASDANFNENVIKTVDLFFYKQTNADASNPEFTEASVYEIIGHDPKPENSTTSITESTTVSFTMPQNIFTDLFENGKCMVYAIVNRPVSDSGNDVISESGAYTMTWLKENIELSTPDFAAKVEDETNTSINCFSKVQDSFVMDGSAIFAKSGNTLTGNIPVERVATKITLEMNIENVKDDNDTEDVTTDDITWEAQTVSVSFRRGLKNTNLGLTKTINSATDRFDLEGITFTNTSGTTTWTTQVPFYTYPTNWGDDDNARTHIVIAINWKSSNNVTKTTYYGVNINPGEKSLVRNHHYYITQSISELGNTVPSGALTLKPTCEVLPWGNAASNGSLERFKYLMVDETNIVLNNETSKTIYFNSSDPVYLKDVKVDWYNTSGATATWDEQADEEYESPATISGNITKNINNDERLLENRGGENYKVEITIHNATGNNGDNQSFITFSHLLDNSNDDSGDDYTPYRINFTVAHIEKNNDNANDLYYQTIDIMQYPMLYIHADVNYDYIYDNPNIKQQNWWESHNNEDKGYVFVNNSQTNDSNGRYWYGVSGMTQTQNPNRYVVTVSSLNTNEYMIGDPRSKSPVDNPTNNRITLANDGEKRLTNYYMTDESAASETMIAPQFMFASSYGVCTKHNMSKDEARARCATYQEDGYPAGRWRIPTEAEILFVTQLSAREVIPELFSSSFNYWSAQGCVTPNNDTGTVTSSNNTTALVRCVYDTWRWGTGQLENRETFVYGDVERR